jgi:hypothetical protein
VALRLVGRPVSGMQEFEARSSALGCVPPSHRGSVSGSIERPAAGPGTFACFSLFAAVQ